MRLLHLADLHIGKIVLEQSMLEDQKYMLNKILALIKKENIDIVIISGDIYDRSVPPADAVEVLNDFLKTLIIDYKIKVCMISGNHDSKERLNFGSDILKNQGLYISSEYKGVIDKVTFSDEYGIINIYMLPYIKPAEVKEYFDEETDVSSFNNAVKEVINKEKIDVNERNIILSHQFVTSGTNCPERSDSETLFLGGTENVDVSCYDKFDYVALGHIHGPQRIGRETARYAGTILKYSFSEANQNKSITIIDFKEKGNISINFKFIAPLRDMRVIKGPIEEILKEENYKAANIEDYIKVILTNEEPIYDAIGQIKKIYPNTLRLEIQNSKMSVNQDINIMELEKLKRKNEYELFNDFYNLQFGKDLEDLQKEIIEGIIKEVKKENNNETN